MRGTSETVTAQRKATLESLTPLIMDAGVPVASYYLLTGVAGMGTVAALAWSSVVPLARTVWGIVRDRRVNALAALMVLVNLISVVLSTVTGDPRLMLAKDSGVSSAIGIGILVSAFLGRPLMTAALKPFLVKGDSRRHAAWERLSVSSERFRRAEWTFSVVWGAALLAECVVRIVGAYTVEVDTMVWLGSVILVAAMGLAMVVAGKIAAEPMAKMINAEVAR